MWAISQPKFFIHQTGLLTVARGNPPGTLGGPASEVKIPTTVLCKPQVPGANHKKVFLLLRGHSIWSFLLATPHFPVLLMQASPRPSSPTHSGGPIQPHGPNTTTSTLILSNFHSAFSAGFQIHLPNYLLPMSPWLLHRHLKSDWGKTAHLVAILVILVLHRRPVLVNRIITHPVTQARKSQTSSS